MENYDVLPVMPGKHNLSDYDETCKDFNWEEVEKSFSWYQTGKVNIAHEAIDKHVDSGLGNKPAFHYCDQEREETYTFAQLKSLSNRFANVLKSLGITKGDRVFIFMPRCPELLISFAGIVRIGAIAGPLFEAFMEEAIRDRLENSEAVAIITTPQLKSRIPKQDLPNLKHIIVLGAGDEALEDREISYEQAMDKASDDLAMEWVDRYDPMFLLYTSGSTGKPKGILHVHNIMVGQYHTCRISQDIQDDDVFWCTADPGWITGVSYSVWGPWLVGKANIIRGGRFSPDDWYATIEKYKVSVWYSAPTAFRMLMAAGNDVAKKYNMTTLRHITSVGEPLNPEVIIWAKKAFNVRIHETWFMTETGVNMICCYPSMPIKVGSMGKPIPGVEAAIIDDDGKVLPPLHMGNLAIKKGWPGMMHTVWKNEAKYNEYYQFDPWYVSGDSAYMDEEGYFWFQGRVDDVIKTSGERVGPFEVESKLVEHPAVAEAGVIGKPDPLRGNIIKAFISLRQGYTWSDELAEEIRQFVKTGLAAHAAPREIEVRDKLPKTRSGKIMRRVLKAEELGLPVGDLSTLED